MHLNIMANCSFCIYVISTSITKHTCHCAANPVADAGFRGFSQITMQLIYRPQGYMPNGVNASVTFHVNSRLSGQDWAPNVFHTLLSLQTAYLVYLDHIKENKGFTDLGDASPTSCCSCCCCFRLSVHQSNPVCSDGHRCPLCPL